MKNLVRNYKKNGGERSKKSKRSDITYILTIYFLTETTQKCANFVDVLLVLHFYFFSLIFQVVTVQWLNCRNLKDELNLFHNGGGVVYLLQSELSYSTRQYPFASSRTSVRGGGSKLDLWVDSNGWVRVCVRDAIFARNNYCFKPNPEPDAHSGSRVRNAHDCGIIIKWFKE